MQGKKERKKLKGKENSPGMASEFTGALSIVMTATASPPTSMFTLHFPISSKLFHSFFLSKARSSSPLFLPEPDTSAAKLAQFSPRKFLWGGGSEFWYWWIIRTMIGEELIKSKLTSPRRAINSVSQLTPSMIATAASKVTGKEGLLVSY